ncbi:MAG: DUF427 domain-containing protein [Acidimicrobiia bacterium]|nr:DUF427 domain-containing protein [Acidimicrobiia bacterium]
MEIVEPKPGQESVWDYPRPPRVEPVSDPVTIVFAGRQVARSDRAVRVLETSHPPVYYVPVDDIAPGLLELTPSSTFCEYKGNASYYSLRVDDRTSADAAWTYLEPSAGFAALRGMGAFYPGRVDACFVGDEQVQPQAGDFYGGWITGAVVGPFKGAPGTRGW